MSDLSLVLENFFATASETFQDTLSSSISAGATTVPILNATEYAEGDVVVLTVEPGTANEATFIGVKDTGNQIIECIWTEGNTAVGHDAGATIIDYDSATHFNAAMKGIQQFANQDGTLKTDAVRAALALGSESVNGWEVLPYTLQVSSGYNNGNKEQEIVIPNADATGLLFPGTKLRTSRTAIPVRQCVDLESTSSQYTSRAAGSVTGALSTVTDDITCEAWIKPESYGSQSGLVSKRNGTTSGFTFAVEGDGRLSLFGYNAGVYEGGTTYQSVQLNKWTHVAGSLDLSGNSYVLYFNGVSVASTLISGSGAISSFTNAGDFFIGSVIAASGFFDGKISDVRVWNTVRTGLQIRDNMNQQLVGSETNLIGYWKLAGDLLDSTSSANNLTGSGGAVATNADHPMNNLEYGFIMKVTYSAPNTVITLFTGTDSNIPNGPLTAPYYSTHAAPAGFPMEKYKWYMDVKYKQSMTQGSSAGYTPINGRQILAPTGNWLAKVKGVMFCDKGSPAQQGCEWVLSTSTSTISHDDLKTRQYLELPATASNLFLQTTVNIDDIPLSMDTPTLFYLISKNDSGNGNIGDIAAGSPTIFTLKCPYI